MIIGLLIIAIIGLIIYICYLKKQRYEVIQFNREQEAKNLAIQRELQQNEEKLTGLKNNIQTENNILQSLIKTQDEMRESAQKRAQAEYEQQKAQLQSQYLQDQSTMELQKNSILRDIEREKKKLADLEAKQLAYVQAKQREEAISANMDYYRLALDQLDINDIEFLRELQPRFVKKETIDKIIWDAYYKPAFDVLSAHLFQTAGTKVCGIYKLTDQITGQSYIGQSVDARERFRTHIKTALTYGKASNKLYQAMQKDGLYNFTFEILEEVPRSDLNDREAYWIGFYKTKEFGLNGTKGNMT